MLLSSRIVLTQMRRRSTPWLSVSTRLSRGLRVFLMAPVACRSAALSPLHYSCRGVQTGDPGVDPPSPCPAMPWVSASFEQGSIHYEWADGPDGAGKVLCVRRKETTRRQMQLFGMPKGYPATVAPGYQSFFYYSITSTFVSNFSSSIGYQTLLGGFFMGSSPQLWMLKDLYPAIVATYLANRVVSYENRPKFWFMVSVLLYNGTVITDMLIPSVLPNHMLFAAVCTSILKQSSALMFLVTRASALQHFAVDNNLAELTKKFNSYGMVIYTVATAVGIGFCTLVPSFKIQMGVALLCVVINLYLAPMSLKPIHYRILNFPSACFIMSAYIRDGQVLTTSEASALMGLRMKPLPEMHGNGILLISPALKKLIINFSTLNEDILFMSKRRSFMLGMFERSTMRRTLQQRLSSFVWGNGPADPHSGKRLVFLVQKDCPVEDIFTAYLLMFTAVLQHGSSTATIVEFLRQCKAEEEIWEARAAEMRQKLRDANWDVDLPLLENPNNRLSALFG